MADIEQQLMDVRRKIRPYQVNMPTTKTDVLSLLLSESTTQTADAYAFVQGLDESNALFSGAPVWTTASATAAYWLALMKQGEPMAKLSKRNLLETSPMHVINLHRRTSQSILSTQCSSQV